MERQKEAFEERYAAKMGKILTKISKETDKARLQAASTKTSPFKVGQTLLPSSLADFLPSPKPAQKRFATIPLLERMRESACIFKPHLP